MSSVGEVIEVQAIKMQSNPTGRLVRRHKSHEQYSSKQDLRRSVDMSYSLSPVEQDSASYVNQNGRRSNSKKYIEYSTKPSNVALDLDIHASVSGVQMQQ